MNEMIDANTLAADYAKRCGWPNKEGFQVVHANDIAKAMLGFFREMEAAKLNNTSMVEKCSFCDRDTEQEPAIIFIKEGSALICEPCIDLAKKRCIDWRAHADSLLQIANSEEIK